MKKVLLNVLIAIILQAQFLPSVIVMAETVITEETSDSAEIEQPIASTDSNTNDELVEPGQETLPSEPQNAEESDIETKPSEEIEQNSGNDVLNNPKVEITTSGAVGARVLTAKLVNEPDARTVIATIADVLSVDKSIGSVIIDGRFGEDNAAGWGRSLDEGNISAIHFKNSNYIPNQLYNKVTGLFEVTDDGSIKSMSFRALRISTNEATSDLRKVELNAIETIDGINLYAFQGKSLHFPVLKTLGRASNSSISDMPFIETIDFPKLEIIRGWRLFRDMPNLKTVDLSNVTEVNVESSFFDARNKFPMYVDLSSLKEFPDVYIGSDSRDGLAPIYMKVRADFASDLTGKDRNVLAYSGLNEQKMTQVMQDEQLKISAFGENFYTFGDDISVNWYINGTRSNYTGAEIELAASDLGVGTFTFKPMIAYKGVEDPDFLRDVEIEAKIKAHQLTAEAVPQEVVLGGEFTKEQLQSFAKNVKLNDQVLNKEEYTIEEVSLPSTSLVGGKNAEIKVIHQATRTETTLEVPVTVLWGHTIYAKEASADGSTGALSLLATEKEPLLVASEGYGDTYASTHLTSRPTFAIFSNNYDNKIGNLHYGTVSQSRAALVSSWNQHLKEVDIKYGDIVSLTVFRYANAAQNYNGNNTWITRNESPVLETTGFPEAFYMITKEGYQLMRVNQLVTNELTFDIGSTTEDIEKRVSEFFDFHDGFDESEKEEFSFELISHDDTSKVGSKKAQIQVTQKKGEYQFSYNYEVSFSIEPGALELSELTNADFNFGEIKQSSRLQEVFAKGNEAPAITINDYSDASQWELQVSRTPFLDKENRELEDTALTLKNLKVSETVHKGLEIALDDVLLDQTPAPIGTMINQNGINGTENGQSVIQIGEAENGILTGISLLLPANTPIDAGTYQTTITWELVSDPTLSGGKQ
ncbi:hypothetical protein D920_02845 [Enterococcus faecalis 13-SD-W-01]|nr:hypothetical protein D920_02845 [Enterococcus faecalis 13-SD-W-01]